MPRIRRLCSTPDGRHYHVREAELSDAPHILEHTRSILAEPQWNVTESDEFTPTLDQEEGWILGFREQPHSMLLVADFGAPGHPEIAGLVSFTTQPRFRVRHRGKLGISVQAPYRHQGVGETLLRTLLEWAESEPELERIELAVFSHNTRAINLYHKLGFVEEARLPRSVKLRDGSYYDDILMVNWVK